MSLQVWLPLNGDLRNLGVSNITITNDGATIDNNGKIGKCYSFNGTNNKIIINNFSVDNEWSYGCWLYSATSTRGWEGVIILNTNGGDSDMQLGLYTYPAGNRIQNTANGQYNSGIPFTYGQWNHFLGTFDGSSLRTYINGVLVNTKTITNGILSRSKLTIGARCRGSNYDAFFQGKINDIRIYDHCLSAAEVKEISQGLVLHYKLDDGVTATSGNLVGNARYGQTAAAGSTWGAHKYYSTQVDLDASAPVPWKKGTKFQLVYDTSLGSGGGGSCSLGRFAAEPSTTYCYSLYINAPDDMAYIHANWMYRYEYEAAYNATAGTRIIEQGVAAKARAENLGNHWYRIWGTFTTNASTHSITFSFFTYPGKSITYYIACPQIEKGTTMTAWSGELGARRVYEDSSGYEHHGLVTGNLSSSNNSARYNNCIYMPNGQTDYITSQDNVGYFTDGITLNIWFKSTNKSPGSGYHHCFNSLLQWVYIEMAVHQNGYLRCGLYINGTRYVNNTNNTNLLDGNWHMLTMTYDGANVKRYVDGVLKDTQAASGNLNTSSDKFIFGHGAATGYYCKEAYLSDARLYVTGLSADDVLELYHTGAKIDNKGNTHTYEFIEHQENILFPVELSRTKLEFTNGLNRYTQANCQVNLVEDGYHIYRPPNLTQSANGNTMWGGLKLVNQSTDTVAAYDANRDNWWHLQQNHTYIAAFHVRGKSSNATTWSWTNNMGWSGGGVQPSPTTIVNEGIPADFNGEKDCFYIFKITDAISKSCTTAYSAYAAGTTYLSYRHLTFGWGYTSTGTLGTDLYLTNFRLYDITSNMAQFTKQGQANFYDIVEQMDKAQIRKNSELLSSEFIEL